MYIYIKEKILYRFYCIEFFYYKEKLKTSKKFLLFVLIHLARIKKKKIID